MTKLVEFKNYRGEILRALFDKAKNKKGIVFIHGFERTTVESKFKNIIDKLKGKINLFRFDFSGCGLSDGKFEDLTIKKLTRELAKAVEIFKKISGVRKISIIGHSLGCAVILGYLKDRCSNIDKVVFLAPGLNQRELHRYWFFKNQFKEFEPVWSTFRKQFKQFEKEFDDYMKMRKRMTKEHFISNAYFLENKNYDYQNLFGLTNLDYLNFLIVHGDADDKVPVESNYNLCLYKGIKKIIVSDGDHDLQRPDMVKQYLNKVIRFLLKD